MANYAGVKEIIEEFKFFSDDDRPPRKIEWVKYDDNEWYHCQGILTLKVDGKEVRISQDGFSYPRPEGCLPAFWNCGKWQDDRNEWEFYWDLYDEDYKDFNFVERKILEQLWKNNAPDSECCGCIED